LRIVDNDSAESCTVLAFAHCLKFEDLIEQIKFHSAPEQSMLSRWIKNSIKINKQVDEQRSCTANCPPPQQRETVRQNCGSVKAAAQSGNRLPWLSPGCGAPRDTVVDQSA
jgi:hypothetical protein